MGIAPTEVDRMTLWQLFATAEGWATAHKTASDGGMSEQEADELWEWLKTRPPVPATHKGNGAA